MLSVPLGHYIPYFKTCFLFIKTFTYLIFIHDLVEVIVVSAGDNKIVQLPEDSTTISAYVIPEDEAGMCYSYRPSIYYYMQHTCWGGCSGLANLLV